MRAYTIEFIDLSRLVPFIRSATTKQPYSSRIVSGKDLLKCHLEIAHGLYVKREYHDGKSEWLTVLNDGMRWLTLYRKRPEDAPGHTPDKLFFDEMSAVLSITTKGQVVLNTREDIYEFLAG
jgi:hypothetical protein